MDAEFLCILEAKEGDWDWAPRWLNENAARRIVFIDSPCLFTHRQAEYKTIDSPLQIEPLANEIAWKAVLFKLEIRGGESPFSEQLKKALKEAHLKAGLLLSDAADWGSSAAKNAFAMRKRTARQGMKLAGAMGGVPALVIGAGPSLEKNGALLERFRDKALLMAGGSALLSIPAEPHWIASIDRQAPYSEFKQHRFWEAPFLFQSRTNADNLSLAHGEAVWFPDSHFPFLQEGMPFDGGWTVGTFLTAVATLMGCNPIVFVGMDYCYRDGRKYAGREDGGQGNLIEAKAVDGKTVWTQPDWLLAREWTEKWAKQHPGTRFIDATEGGLGFGSPIEAVPLASLSFEAKGDLRKAVQDAVFELPCKKPFDWEEWRRSLEECRAQAGAAIFGNATAFDEEAVYEKLLNPLWAVWQPVFTRALEFDPHPDKLRINRLLFFQQVIEEHLHAIE